MASPTNCTTPVLNPVVTIQPSVRKAQCSRARQPSVLTGFQHGLYDTLDELALQPFVQLEILRSADDGHDQSRRFDLPRFEQELGHRARLGLDVTTNVMRSTLRQISIGVIERRFGVLVPVPLGLFAVDDVLRVFTTESMAAAAHFTLASAETHQ